MATFAVLRLTRRSRRRATYFRELVTVLDAPDKAAAEDWLRRSWRGYEDALRRHELKLVPPGHSFLVWRGKRYLRPLHEEAGE